MHRWLNITNRCLQHRMPPKKQPSSAIYPKSEKIPRHLNPYQDPKKVFWSLSIYDASIQFPEAGIPQLYFSEIADHLKNCETRTWLDIDRNRHRDHPIDKNKLAKFARERLISLGQDDVDELWSIHINGLMRIWGIRDQSLFKILWVDPQHEVCPSRLDNT